MKKQKNLFGNRIVRKSVTPQDSVKEDIDLAAGQLDGYIGNFVEMAQLFTNVNEFKADKQIIDIVKSITEKANLANISENYIVARMQSEARKLKEKNPNNNVSPPLIDDFANLAKLYKSMSASVSNAATADNAPNSGEFSQQQAMLKDLLDQLDAAITPEEQSRQSQNAVEELDALIASVNSDLEASRAPEQIRQQDEANLDAFLRGDAENQQMSDMIDQQNPNISPAEKAKLLAQVRIDAGTATLSDLEHFEPRKEDTTDRHRIQTSNNPVQDLRLALIKVGADTKNDKQFFTELSAILNRFKTPDNDGKSAYTLLSTLATNSSSKENKQALSKIDHLSKLLDRAEHARTSIGTSLIRHQIVKHVEKMRDDPNTTKALKEIDPKVMAESAKNASGFRPK